MPLLSQALNPTYSLMKGDMYSDQIRAEALPCSCPAATQPGISRHFDFSCLVLGLSFCDGALSGET